MFCICCCFCNGSFNRPGGSHFLKDFFLFYLDQGFTTQTHPIMCLSASSKASRFFDSRLGEVFNTWETVTVSCALRLNTTSSSSQTSSPVITQDNVYYKS